MEDFYTNISQDESFNHNDTLHDYYDYFNYFDYFDYFNYLYFLDFYLYFLDYYNYLYYFDYYSYFDDGNYDEDNILHVISVVTYVIIGIGLPLILAAIIVLYSTIRNDHVAPIYVINLLISDVIQLCCMISHVTRPIGQVPAFMQGYTFKVYFSAVTASIGFMVCIALERYLVIACPLWYHFRRTIKSSVVVCVLVWSLGLLYFIADYFWLDDYVSGKITFFYFLFPFPLFIFFLVGTIKGLSGTASVPSDEKRRIVGVLVLMLLIYALLYLPTIIILFPGEITQNTELRIVSTIFIRLSPLADLLLYIFMRKGTIDKILTSVCCCKIEEHSNNTRTLSP